MTTNDWPSLTPKEFELIVVAHLQQLGRPLKSFTIQHQATLCGPDGQFDLDAVATFEALELDFTVIVECKHHRNPIKRELIQVLADKVLSLRAQKGVVFSTAQFQSGAVEFAYARHIALLQLVSLTPAVFVGVGPRLGPTWLFANSAAAIASMLAASSPPPKGPIEARFLYRSADGQVSFANDSATRLAEFLFAL